MEKIKRTKIFEKNESVEKYLAEFNELIQSIDTSVIEDLEGQAFPVLFIIGSQRSGTTLLSQMLINHFELAYPNNFIARFWNAPLFGTIIYRQIYSSITSLEYKSSLGYTEGPHGPHEFGYFWKQYFGQHSSPMDGDKELPVILKSLTMLTESPWLFKNLHSIHQNINEILSIYPEAYFIHIRRDLIDCAVSTYKSRVQLYGTDKAWFGPKPSNFELIKNEPVEKQILLQIHQLDIDIKEQLKNVNTTHHIGIDSERLLSFEKETLTKINKHFPFLKSKGLDISDNPHLFSTQLGSRDELYDKFKSVALALNLYIDN